jgi:hypothetical protein
MARDEMVADSADVDCATRVVRVHCRVTWPDGAWCLNCRHRFPCPAYTWAFVTLVYAGWDEDRIDALDQRTGPWS